VLSLWDWVEGLSSLTGGLGESGDGCIWGLNNKNIPADVRRTIVEELSSHKCQRRSSLLFWQFATAETG